MKDDVLRFRKICQVLLESNTKRKKDLEQLTGLSTVAIHKILHSDLNEEFHLRASTLGIIQDFNKKFCDYENMKISEIQASNAAQPPSTEEGVPPNLSSLLDKVLQQLPDGAKLTITLHKKEKEWIAQQR